MVDNSGNVKGRHDYHPFGLTWANPETQTGTNRYLYNVKESQEMAGLDLVDYGWRMSDKVIIRFGSPDPMTEYLSDISPYAFSLNNPISNFDLDGLFPFDYRMLSDNSSVTNGSEGEPTYEIETIVVKGSTSTPQMRPWWSKYASYLPGWDASQRSADAWARGEYWSSVKHFGLGLLDMGSTFASGGAKTGVQFVGRVSSKTAEKTIAKAAARKIFKPKGWKKVRAKNKQGVKYVDPNNPHNQIRIMNGNPNSQFPGQQRPYVKFQKDGRFYDVNGNVLPNGNILEAHIPLELFDMSVMPPF